MEQMVVTSKKLATIFGVSERQIQKLVDRGVLENVGTGRAYRFALDTAVQQYAAFLMSGISAQEWALDT